MKTKSVLFFIYVLVMILLLVALLIFKPMIEKYVNSMFNPSVNQENNDQNANDDDINNGSSDEDNNFEEDNNDNNSNLPNIGDDIDQSGSEGDKTNPPEEVDPTDPPNSDNEDKNEENNPPSQDTPTDNETNPPSQDTGNDNTDNGDDNNPPLDSSDDNIIDKEPDINDDNSSDDEKGDDNTNTDNDISKDPDNNTNTDDTKPNDGNNSNDDNLEDNNKDDNENNNEDTNPDEVIQEEIFATDLIINHSEYLQAYVNKPIVLLDEFVLVEPADKVNLLTYSITSRYNSDISKVTFDGKQFLASEAGQYNLIYSVPNTKDKTLEAKIVIKVDEEDPTISQKLDSAIVGSTMTINDIFDINSGYDVQFNTSDHFTIVDNSIIPNKSGAGYIKILIRDNYVVREYSFDILVKDKPKYIMEISTADGEVIDPTSDTIELSADIGMFGLGCVVYDAQNQPVPQNLSIEISDENIVQYIPLGDSILLFNCMSSGIVTIKIVFNLDSSICQTITLNIN